MTDKRRCWRCKGTGKTVEYNLIKGTDETKPCWRCGGTGKDK